MIGASMEPPAGFFENRKIPMSKRFEQSSVIRTLPMHDTFCKRLIGQSGHFACKCSWLHSVCTHFCREQKECTMVTPSKSAT